jgi:acetyl-CoA carboxylase carboxyl transferase subunit beta
LRPTSSWCRGRTSTCAWPPSAPAAPSTAATTEVPAAFRDPLKFRDGKRYTDRLKTAKADTDLQDAVLVGEGYLEGQEVVAAAQDFRFMGGSLGMAAGEGVIVGMMRAVEKHAPFILFAASGGARMQEGILSLMQMPRTTVAVEMLRDAKKPYIVVLNSTTGGLPRPTRCGRRSSPSPALIGFAAASSADHPQNCQGFQKSEYLVITHGRYGRASAPVVAGARRSPAADKTESAAARLPRRPTVDARLRPDGGGAMAPRAMSLPAHHRASPDAASKRIDLSLDRMWRILAALDPSAGFRR